jgi:2-polyprenyl-3-methyl-5-hydroxy-6-metoxy-1,4-benzoquinol methylase
MISLDQCPVCQKTQFSSFIECKDHTVSHETFELVACDACGFVFTNPQPAPHELANYYESDAYISHSNKTQNPIDWLYKISRAFTLRWKYELIRKYSIKKPYTVLDFGCGTGSFLRECIRHKMKIAGVEPSDTARQHARTITGDAVHDDLAKISGQFDVITLWHVLEHISQLTQTLDSLIHLLDKDGTMFIAVPNLKSLDAAAYGEYWAAYDVPRHLWHFSRTSMEHLLRNRGLKLIRTVPMKLDAYYVSLLSEKYKDSGLSVNYASAFTHAWKSNHAARTTTEYSSLIYIARK